MEREELIDKFLLGTLSPEEEEQFNKLKEQEVSFRNGIAFIQDLKIVSGVEDRNDLKKNLINFESKINEKEISSLSSYKKWAIAASIILVVTLSSILIFNPFAPDTAQLYTENFEPYKNVISTIVRGSNTEEDEEASAFANYEQENYELAADQFSSLFSTTKRPYFLLYQANALLAAGQANEAIAILEQHVLLKGPLSARGKWYLALAYLKENKKTESIMVLGEIVQKGTFKKGAAEQLLNKLK